MKNLKQMGAALVAAFGLTIIHAACGAPPPEFEVFGVATEGLVEPGDDGVLQTDGDRMTITARYNGEEAVTVHIFVGPQVNVKTARADDGTALPEVMDTEVKPVIARKLEASVLIEPRQWRIQPGSAYRVRAEWWSETAMLHAYDGASWIGDAPGERL